MALSLGSTTGGGGQKFNAGSIGKQTGQLPNISSGAGYASSTQAPGGGGFAFGGSGGFGGGYGGGVGGPGTQSYDLFRAAVPYDLDPFGQKGGGGGGGGGGSFGGGQTKAQQRQEAERNKLAMASMETANKQATYDYRSGIAQDRFDANAVGQLSSQFQPIVENYNTAYGEARDANEARYQQSLGIADATTGQRLNDITSAYDQQAADAQQRNIGLGFGNTSGATTLGFGFEREKQASLNRAADEMQQTKLGIIDRKEDNFPDLASLQGIIGSTSSAFGTKGIDAMLQAFGNVRSV
jgi:hypothetical protein